VELEWTEWITVVCWSHINAVTGTGRQCTNLCVTILQKTAAVVFSLNKVCCRRLPTLWPALASWKMNLELHIIPENSRYFSSFIRRSNVIYLLQTEDKRCYVNLCCKSERNTNKVWNIMLNSYFSFSWISCKKNTRRYKTTDWSKKVRPAHIFSFYLWNALTNLVFLAYLSDTLYSATNFT